MKLRVQETDHNSVRRWKLYLEGLNTTEKIQQIYSYSANYRGMDLLEMFLGEIRDNKEVSLSVIQTSMTQTTSKRKSDKGEEKKVEIPQDIDELSYKFTKDWLRKAKKAGIEFEGLSDKLLQLVGKCRPDLIKYCDEHYPSLIRELSRKESQFVPTSHVVSAGYRSDAVDLTTIPRIPSGNIKNAGWETKHLVKTNSPSRSS